jgi:chromate transporter
MYIFAFAPYVEAVRQNRQLKGLLSAITAAVVGVILNLSIWFGMRVLFAKVREFDFGWGTLTLPEWPTIQPVMLLLATGAALAMFKYKRGMLETLAACALLGILFRFLLG